jgi:hemoglobin-like flavoprotein
MTTTAIAEDVRLRLTQSIAIVEGHRAEFTSRMQAHLAALGTEDEASAQAEATGAMLVELLVESASRVAACGTLGDLSEVSAEHRRLAINGRHYSRFGLALAPMLHEVLGPSLPPRIVSAWCDVFWFAIRHLGTREEPKPKLRLNIFARS